MTKIQKCLRELSERADAGAILIGALMLMFIFGIMLGEAC